MGPPATRSTSKCNNAQVKPGARPRGSRARNGAGGHRPGATLPYGLNPLKPAPTPWPQVYLCVALTTLATLLLELSLTRIFSVVFYYHFAFLAISIALFGLGVGGVFSYIVAGWKTPLFRKLGYLSMLNSLLVMAALAVVVAQKEEPGVWRLTLVYFTTSLPF